MKLKKFTFIFSLVVSAIANSQESSSPEEKIDSVQTVEISGVRNPELKPYRQMLKGLDAFETFHSLAPTAELKFQLVSDTKEIVFNKVSLAISGSNTRVELPVSQDGTFVLPRIQAAADDGADIVSNMPKGLLRWRGDIRSPNVPTNARRLGDLRLECEIGWAINREDMSFFVRNSLSLVGGLCHSKMIGLRYQAPQKLSSIMLVSGERKMQLLIEPTSKRVFWPPLADTSWDNDSLIMYEFESAEPK